MTWDMTGIWATNFRGLRPTASSLEGIVSLRANGHDPLKHSVQIFPSKGADTLALQKVSRMIFFELPHYKIMTR